jgi:shikimate kinase
MTQDKTLTLVNGNVFLIGPMGAGKTSVGQHLAKFFNATFYDTDHVLQKQTGVDLAWIYHMEKEEGLRRRENKILKQLVKEKNIVMATGGGTILWSENRSLLKNNGLVIYLKTSVKIQKTRTRFSKHNRPLLDTPRLSATLDELHRQRAPIYNELADRTYDASSYSAYHLARHIFNDLQ